MAVALAALGLLCPGTDAQTAIVSTAPTIFTHIAMLLVFASLAQGQPVISAGWNSLISISHLRVPTLFVSLISHRLNRLNCLYR